jgi:hypothetical protein
MAAAVSDSVGGCIYPAFSMPRALPAVAAGEWHLVVY